VWSERTIRTSKTGLGLAGALAFGAPAAGAAEVRWNAPESCQRAAIVGEQVEGLIGRSLSSVESPSFLVTVTERNSGWRVEVITLGSTRSTRTLDGPTCDAVTDAAGVAMAMAIRAADPSPPPSEPPASENPAEPPPKTTAAAPARARPRRTAGNGERRLRALARLGITVDSGALPGVAPGVSAAAALQARPFRLELEGAAFLPRSADLEGGRSAEFSLFTGALLGCLEHDVVATLMACAAFEAGRLAGEGRGITRGRVGVTLWQAARIEAGVAMPRQGELRVVLRGGAALPLVRREFELDRTAVHRPAPLTLRLTLGAELAP
jgi:hypothetical protein